MDFDQGKMQEFSNWKQRYTAALFELDQSRMGERITDAETAVISELENSFRPSPMMGAGRFQSVRRLCTRCAPSAASPKIMVVGKRCNQS